MRTLKIVGLPGSGKTTLIKEMIERCPQLVSMSYGDLLREHGQSKVDSARKTFLSKQEGKLVLVDAHLEIGDEDLSTVFRQENTCGFFLLEVSAPLLIERRIADTSRARDIDPSKAEADWFKAKERALKLSSHLGVPISLVFDATINESVIALEKFIQKLGG